ncbi:hypothetical protein BC834DRAFT_834368 [Gloeopeniophorella convolvens]|nr:hypothetical protein BC834DRAFT_834368 [Gloeopeniophorella convolvens]
MQFTIVITNLFSIFAAALLSAGKATPRVFARDVYAPTITSPRVGTVWKIGTEQTVTWDNSNPPVQITNPIGHILLLKGGVNTNITLASCFNIVLGSIGVTVPNVTPGRDYSIVLFGDSGDISPDFTITN